MFNRVQAITDSDAGTTDLAVYSYLGLGAVVRVDYTEPQVRSTVWMGTVGVYNGLDRFGRIIDLSIFNYNTSSGLVRIEHGYDRNSNRLWRQNDIARGLAKKFDQQYTYDQINRLTFAKHGRLNSSHAIPTNDLTFRQQWGLGPVGNWDTFNQDDDGNGVWNLKQTRQHNEVNEITGIGADAGAVWATPTYDPAGNTISFPKPSDLTSSYDATYDAWNRLVRIEDPGPGTSSSSSSSSSGAAATLVAEYEYDGHHWRTVAKNYTGGTLDETRHYYYTAAWQVIEERLGDTPDSSGADRQFVWGLRYIDDLILRDRAVSSSSSSSSSSSGVSPLNERLYALQDPNFNVAAIVDATGDVMERYEYDAYGVCIVLDADFDPVANNTSVYDWETRYAGYRYDPRTGLYTVRNRVYLAELGHWGQRDSIGYMDSLNLYEYTMSGPVLRVDPTGLQEEENCKPTLKILDPLELDTQKYIQEYREGVSGTDPNSIVDVPTGGKQHSEWADNKLQSSLRGQAGEDAFIYQPHLFENKPGLKGQVRYAVAVDFGDITVVIDGKNCCCCFKNTVIYFQAAIAYNSQDNSPLSGVRVWATADKQRRWALGEALTPLEHERLHVKGGPVRDARGNTLWTSPGLYGGARTYFEEFSPKFEKICFGVSRQPTEEARLEEHRRICKARAKTLVKAFATSSQVFKPGEFHPKSTQGNVE